MPGNLPPDAERMLSRRCEKQGVKELAVPLGDGWMQRAGRGSYSMSKAGDKGAPVMEIESLEPSFFLITYDQTPEAHITRSGEYRIDATLRALAGHPNRETPCVAVALNWVRGRSTITNPCFTAVVLSAGAWRVEQYAEGRQTTIAEVRDAAMKAGGAFYQLAVEVRGDKLSVHVNKRPVFHTLCVPPLPPPGASGAASSSSRGAALTGSVGLAVHKCRAEVKKFTLSALAESATSSALAASRPPFTGGDPKLVELIEGEMLEGCAQVAWDSVGGCAEAKRLLNEAVVLPLLIPDYFAAAACRSTWKGVLLFGPPGTGKTLLAKAVASLGKTAFFNISASSLVSKYHGESEKLCRTLFALARHHAPSVVFFDEIDALASARGAAGEHEASRRLKSELLTQMDGVVSGGGAGVDESVMVLATTNKPWDLDEAMRRRLERRIYVPLPSEAERREMLRIHLNGATLGDDVDLDVIAQRTAGYSGADLQLACRDASMMPMRRMVDGKSPDEIVRLQAAGALDTAVSMADFHRALQYTQPSTASHEHRLYAAWNAEFGSDPRASSAAQGEAGSLLTLTDQEPTVAPASAPEPAPAAVREATSAPASAPASVAGPATRFLPDGSQYEPPPPTVTIEEEAERAAGQAT